MKNKMNIVFACSKEYAKYACIMLKSLFESNKEHSLVLYVAIQEALGEWKNRMEALTEQYGNRIQFIMLPENLREKEILKVYPCTINTDRWLAVNLLPDEVERFLTLGIDIIVKGDLWEFYNSDFQDNCFIMCRDMCVMTNADSDYEFIKRYKQIYEKYQLGDIREKNGNCEIAVVNRSVFEKVFDYNQMIDTILENQYDAVDQDYFNIHMSNYIDFIEPYEYNYMAEIGDYDKVIDRIKILHYPLKKPWVEFLDTKWEKLWREYAWNTPYCDEIIKNYEEYTADIRYKMWKNHEKNYSVLNRWMGLKDDNKSILESYNFSSVALYGAGTLSEHFIVELNNKAVDCKAVFDKNTVVDEVKGIEVCHDIDVYLERIRDVDVIIVTAVSAYEAINNYLKDKTDLPVISLEDIVLGKSYERKE